MPAAIAITNGTAVGVGVGAAVVVVGLTLDSRCVRSDGQAAVVYG